MNLTPLKKGFLPTSTPIQSFCDSGYFGSDNKSSSAKAVHALSPIKECSPSKKKYTELIQLGRTYSLETPQYFKIPSNSCLEGTPTISNELVKELNFNDLSDFSESLHDCLEDSGVNNKSIDYNQFPSLYIEDFSFPKLEAKKLLDVYSQQCGSNESSKACEVDVLFSPVIVDNFWKEKVSLKNKKIDFFEELSKINCNFIISSILSCLSSDDLCRVCCVNKKWRNIVVQNAKANSRRKEFLREENARKENKPSKTSLDVFENTKPTLAGERKTVLCDVINTTTIFKQPLKQNISRFDSFIKEGQNMKNGSLMKCPSCQYAAKGSDGGDEFCCTNCNYTFCRRCLNPILVKNHVCHKVKVSIVIGSKRSKKSLKRL